MSLMDVDTGRAADRLHLLVALLSCWLVLSSPWIAMLRSVPRGAGVLDYAHVTLGWFTLALTAAYAFSCARGGGWRQYVPTAVAPWRAVLEDLRGLLRGRRPSAEGGGLFALLEGLLLITLLLTAATGAAWFVVQGTPEALAWRSLHVACARVLVPLIVLHAASVSLHVLDLARD